LLAHGLSVKKFRDSKFKSDEIGISLSIVPGEPFSERPEDIHITKLFNAIWNDMFIESIYYGKYPEVLNEIPFISFEMSDEDKNIISAKTDFLGINYYTRAVCRYNPKSFLKCENVKIETSQYTEMGSEIYPDGLYKLLHSIKDKYNNPKIYITENGMADKDELIDGKIDDHKRINYLNDHIQISLKAMREGVNLKGYFIWSLMDNFEWAFGFSKRFGLFYTDFKTLDRIPKNSAIWLKNIIKK
jgi:beta-glucosidase